MKVKKAHVRTMLPVASAGFASFWAWFYLVLLSPYPATHAGCGPMPSTPVKPTPCDRSTGDIAGRGTVSLTAGPLVLGNVSVLGEVGDVLILANSEDRLFYFVCRSTIGFIG